MIGDVIMEQENEIVEFTIKCTTKRRWASQLVGMFSQMQYLGNIGSSRMISFYADGDGDFRPKFEIDTNI